MSDQKKDDKPIIIEAKPRERKLKQAGKQVFIGTVNIFVPPLAHKIHGRYEGKKHHLLVDTLLALVIFLFIAANIFV